MQDNEKNTLIHLSLIPGIGPATIAKIIATIGQEKHRAFSCLHSYQESDIQKKFSLAPTLASRLVEGLRDRAMLQTELEHARKENIRIITLLDDEYPEELSDIYLPPPVLYCKGAPLTAAVKKLAIVGSRNAGTYARTITNALVADIVANNWTIVSGGAFGVDSMAHRAALDAGGMTIAILGSGLLQPYPRENKTLFGEIVAKGGTLVSPFSLHIKPLRGNFPARNRIIAALSRGTIVVQAGAQSGAKITAQFALEQGKEVFAIPGNIFDELSAGCHELITQGAKLASSAKDILEEFNEELTRTPKKKPTYTNDFNSKESLPTAQNHDQNQKPPMSQETNPLLAALHSPRSLDDLCSDLGTEIAVLQAQLFDLQLEGKVMQNFAGLWVRI